MQKQYSPKTIVAVALAWVLAAGVSVSSVLARSTPPDAAAATDDADRAGRLDVSGRPRVGVASYYAARFGGRTMADGTPFRVNGNNAASLTLPLGTKARVTNLDTGKSAVVVIRDRGPYVGGRIVDLSPRTARNIGIDRKAGVANVQVAPLAVPLSDGRVNVVAQGRGPDVVGN